VLVRGRDEVVDGEGVQEARVDLIQTRDSAHPHRRFQLVIEDYLTRSLVSNDSRETIVRLPPVREEVSVRTRK
jgi:hypothetical protein